MRIEFRGKSIPVTVIRDEDLLVQSLELLEKEVVLGIDIETFPIYPHVRGGLHPHVSGIRLIQIYDGKRVLVVELRNALKATIKEWLPTRRFVAHNALFELTFLTELCGEGTKLNIGCSQIMYNLKVHATEPDPEKIKTSLAAACKAELGVDIDKSEQVSDWGAENLTDEQLMYAALDAVATRELAISLAPFIADTGQNAIYQLTKRAQAAVVEMQLTGIYFDRAKHATLMEEWAAKQVEYKDALEKIFGGQVENINSSKQISDWMLSTYPVTRLKSWKRSEKTGHINLNKENLANNSHFAFVPALLEYKKYEKLSNTYGEELLSFTMPLTGRIHPNFTLGRTTTGRMSSNSPNLQNQPKGSGMRSLYIPGPGKIFSLADYNQMELRVLAHIAKDPVMLSVYENGQDLHLKTASTLAALAGVDLSTAEESVVKSFRNKAKAINFGIVFGIGPKKLPQYAKQSYGVDMSEGEAREVIKAFKKTFPAVAEWQRVHTKMCGHYLCCKTAMGKLRKLHKDFYYTTGLNTPVQGTAAEITLLALCKLHERKEVDVPEYSMVNVVHDEIILEHSPEYSEAVRDWMEKCMTDAYTEIMPGAPIANLVDARSGYSWEEAK